MTDTELTNQVNSLYRKGWTYDEIAKHLHISWAEVINRLEVDMYE